VRFIQGLDYGPRRGTLGFAIHMTEGNGGIGDALYLAQRPNETDAQWKARVRGVSANFVIIEDGEVIQMVKWANASGSMNPADRSDDTGFYQSKYIKAVLGDHYTNPNAYSISVEIAGKRADGPTKAQVASLIALVAEARERYPTLRGAYGHADQTDTKGCPGTAPTMREAWDAIGHGLFPPDTATGGDEVTYKVVTTLPTGRLTLANQEGIAYLRLRDGEVIEVTDREAFGTKEPILPVRLDEPMVAGKPDTDDWRLGYIVGEDAAFVLARNVVVNVPLYTVTVGGKTVGKVPLP
jgi:hypothetical protein